MATGITGAKRPVSQTGRPESAERLGPPAAFGVRIAGTACLALGMVLGATQASWAATSGERALDAVITVAPANARLSASVRDLLMSEFGTGAAPRREDLIRIADEDDGDDGDDEDDGDDGDDEDDGDDNEDDNDCATSPTNPGCPKDGSVLNLRLNGDDN